MNSVQEERMRELISMAKKTVEECGDHAEMFFFVDDGVLNVMDIAYPESDDVWIDKELKLEALRSFIEKFNISEYYHVASGWMVDKVNIKAKIMEDLKRLKENPSKEAMIEFLDRTAKRVRRPSEHPDRKSVLIVSCFSKSGGTDSVFIPYEFDDGVCLWGEDIWNSGGHSYNRYNVWVQEQIDVVEGENGELEL